METPYGKDCSYYYEDYNRGRDIQECRLAAKAGKAAEWTPKLCQACPVPGIERANSCRHMILEGTPKKGFLGMNKRMECAAVCSKSLRDVPEPQIGCGQCHDDNPIWDALFAEDK